MLVVSLHFTQALLKAQNVEMGTARLVLPGCVQNRLIIIQYYYVEMTSGCLLVFVVLIVVVG
jgi:hypothetical protein